LSSKNYDLGFQLEDLNTRDVSKMGLLDDGTKNEVTLEGAAIDNTDKVELAFDWSRTTTTASLLSTPTKALQQIPKITHNHSIPKTWLVTWL
jgi:hypothetical protein